MLYIPSENFVTSTEAVNNIASVYNADTLTATNINATANIGAIGNVNAGNAYVVGPSTNPWIISPGMNGEQKLLMIAPMLSNGAPDINNNFVLHANGNSIWTNKNITTTGNVTVTGAINSGPIATGSTISASGNITGGSITSTGQITSLGNGVPIVLKSESGKELWLQARDWPGTTGTLLQIMSPNNRGYANVIAGDPY